MHIYDKHLNYIEEIPYSLELILQTYPKYQTEHYFSEVYIQYPKLQNGELVSKTNTELKLDGIIPLLEGELISNGKIVVVERPNGLKLKWNGLGWIETATLEEQEESLRNQIISRTDELIKIQLAGFNNFELQKEIETLRNSHLEITHQIAINSNL